MYISSNFCSSRQTSYYNNSFNNKITAPEEEQMKGAPGGALEGLVVGSYLLLRDMLSAAAFVSNVLDAALPRETEAFGRPRFRLRLRAPPTRHPPLLCAAPTTSFHAQFSDAAASGHAPDRELRRVRTCDPIYPADLPDRRFAYRLVVGVAGEVLLETLERMIRLCRAVLVDVQALIRAFDGEGSVRHVELEGTPYACLLPRVAFLKASSEEARGKAIKCAPKRLQSRGSVVSLRLASGFPGTKAIVK